MAQTSTATSASLAQRRDSRRLLVALLYGLAALGGVSEAVNPTSWTLVLHTILFATIAVEWCVVDAYQRDRPIVSVVQMLMFFTWPFAVTVYLIVSRGWRGLLYAMLHAVRLFVTAAVYLNGTLFLLYYLAERSPPTQ